MFMGLNNSSNIDNFLFFVSKELIIYIYIFKIYTVGYNINWASLFWVQSALKSLICDAESNTNAEENASAAFSLLI